MFSCCTIFCSLTKHGGGGLDRHRARVHTPPIPHNTIVCQVPMLEHGGGLVQKVSLNVFTMFDLPIYAAFIVAMHILLCLSCMAYVFFL